VKLTRLALAVVVLATTGCMTKPSTVAPKGPPLIASAGQMVVVTTRGWNDVRGSLWRFSRASATDSWHLERGPIPVVVGRTGLAWGIGFDALDDVAHPGPHKHEGDGKSPAGVFPLDTVFGYAPPSAAPSLRMPYVQLTEASDCVDDTASVHYNTVVARNAVPLVDWNSAERMRSVWQYEMGVIVGYNAPRPTGGRGSCIFLHIWDGPDSHTAGCTAFDRQELQQLIAWLDSRKRPVLVQLTSADYARWKADWKLPPVL
jgi:D-alanyl-D-alanine dipeptidase